MAELTYRLFMIATVGMLAGTVFLLASSREVDPKHRRGVYISALVTGIAWYHYNKMTGSWAGGEFDTGLKICRLDPNSTINVRRGTCRNIFRCRV
jgi:hypothetical protein